MRLPAFLSLFLITLMALSALPDRTAHATEVAGKWGLGFSVGDILDSRAEGSIIRGRSASTAWVLDVGVNEENIDRKTRVTVSDTTSVYKSSQDNWSVLLGPRLRHFTRPDAAFSPYWDVIVHGTYSRAKRDDNAGDLFESRGALIGIDVGAEYFFSRWPVSAAVHTSLVNGSYAHEIREHQEGGYQVRETFDSWSAALRLGPVLQLRAYF
jgi:hypothetical protein